MATNVPVPAHLQRVTQEYRQYVDNHPSTRRWEDAWPGQPQRQIPQVTNVPDFLMQDAYGNWLYWERRTAVMKQIITIEQFPTHVVTCWLSHRSSSAGVFSDQWARSFTGGIKREVIWVVEMYKWLVLAAAGDTDRTFPVNPSVSSSTSTQVPSVPSTAFEQQQQIPDGNVTQELGTAGSVGNESGSPFTGLSSAEEDVVVITAGWPDGYHYPDQGFDLAGPPTPIEQQPLASSSTSGQVSSGPSTPIEQQQQIPDGNVIQQLETAGSVGRPDGYYDPDPYEEEVFGARRKDPNSL